MKRVTLFAMFLVAGATAFAQVPKFTLGIKAGMNIAKLKADFAEEDNQLGYQAGAFARIGTAGFYLQPEAYFGSKGGSFNFKNDNSTVSGNAKVKFTNLDVPILLGTKIGTNKINARFMAGPVISFVLDKNTTFSNTVGDVSDFDDFKDQTWGGQVGAGVDLGNLSVDLRYEAGLTNVNQSNMYDQKQNLWHISLGFKLF